MATTEDILMSIQMKLTDEEFKVFKAMSEALIEKEKETKELKQQLTEANALIEKMGRALNHCKKQASEIECGCDDYNGFTCGLHAWKEDLDYSIEQYNEYKAKQTTQEVKP